MDNEINRQCNCECHEWIKKGFRVPCHCCLNAKGDNSLTMLLKDHNTKTLVTGDKVTRITLETLEPEQVEILKQYVTCTTIKVKLSEEE